MYALNEQKHKKRLGELRRQLKSLEKEQVKLESKGIELERKLRSKVIAIQQLEIVYCVLECHYSLFVDPSYISCTPMVMISH